MRKSIISFVLAAGLLCQHALAEDVKKEDLQATAPDRYVVVKGDTLWAISGKFLKSPWRWPEIWRMNKDEIKNPHWIYPGDVIVLDMSDGKARLRLLRDGQDVGAAAGTQRLSPRVRESSLAGQSLKAIPPSVIEPFLNQPLVVDETELSKNAKVVAGPDNRVVYTHGDRIYAVNLAGGTGQKVHIYRQGDALLDPDVENTNKSLLGDLFGKKQPTNLLGYEAIYVGDAVIKAKGDVATLSVLHSKTEIQVGDRLVPATEAVVTSYIPHAPKDDIRAKIVSIVGGTGTSEGGTYSVVVINKGWQQGMEAGHVLRMYRHGRAIPGEKLNDKQLMTPPEEYGRLMIFRTFAKLSYALVMESESEVQIGDLANTP